tara:strand:+ start:12189 stop:12782 length:594 start_codon:yes stop_codon:yes gene_type:complete
MATNTKDKVLEAAHSLFEQKGFDGVSMRDIASEAKVNKGLLHYYFKSKHAIFMGVFKLVSKLVYVNLSDILNRKDIDFDAKIDLMVDSYFDLLTKHPKMPLFVLSELGKYPEFAAGTDLGGTLNEAALLIENNLNELQPVPEGEGFQFLMSMVSLCVFPFMAAPIVTAVKPRKYADNQQFMMARKTQIKQTLKKSYK